VDSPILNEVVFVIVSILGRVMKMTMVGEDKRAELGLYTVPRP
jgi:hypothetical protein